MRWRVKLKLTYQSLRQIQSLMFVLCLALIALTGLLWTRSGAAALTTEPAVRFPRQFYLTSHPPYYTGAQALQACAPGYHMASLWEMVNVTGLIYNQTLGDTNADMGRGPISGIGGWVRTGHDSSSTGSAGSANCNAWTSESSSHIGTTAFLPSIWDSGGEDVGVWNVGSGLCSGTLRVWCMADRPGYPLFMPFVVR